MTSPSAAYMTQESSCHHLNKISRRFAMKWHLYASASWIISVTTTMGTCTHCTIATLGKSLSNIRVSAWYVDLRVGGILVVIGAYIVLYGTFIHVYFTERLFILSVASAKNTPNDTRLMLSAILSTPIWEPGKEPLLMYTGKMF